MLSLYLPFPSMLIFTPCSWSSWVKWLPWTVLKTSGLTRASVYAPKPAVPVHDGHEVEEALGHEQAGAVRHPHLDGHAGKVHLLSDDSSTDWMCRTDRIVFRPTRVTWLDNEVPAVPV